MLRLLLLSSLFSISYLLNAQNISVKLIDSETKEPIPFADILLAKDIGLMTNEEGEFSLLKEELSKANDSIQIYCLGYERLSLHKDSILGIIAIKPKVFEIGSVSLSSSKLTAKEVIEKVKENLSDNYKDLFTKSDLFVRKTNVSNNKKVNFLLEKSTIKEINKDLFQDLSAAIPKKSTSHNEVLAKWYHNKDNSKVQIIKALSMENSEKATVDPKILQDKLMHIYEDEINPDSYLVFKTGILRIGKSETIKEMKENKEVSIGIGKSKKVSKPKSKEEKYTERINNSLKGVLKEILVINESEVNVLNKSNKYRFEKVGFVEFGETYAYVIDFSPKGNAKHKGKLYVSFEDFAILKADIFSAKKVYDKQFNMLGVNVNVLDYRSIVMFSKDENNSYYLRYFEREKVNDVKAERSFTIIEKYKKGIFAKTNNKIKLNFEINTTDSSKIEIVQSKVEKIFENTFNTTNIKDDFVITEEKDYPKSFWQGYNVITPEKAVQELKIED